MAHPEMVKDFLDVCESINELAPRKEEFINCLEDWGNKSREEIEEEINTVFWLAEEAEKLPVRMLPNGAISSAAGELNRIKNSFDQVDRTADSDKSKQPPDRMDWEFSRAVDSAMSTLGTWFPLLALRSGNIDNLAARTKKLNAEADELLRNAQRQAEAELQEIEEIKQAAREAAGAAGAAEFTREFRDEADEARIRAWWWLGAAAVLAMAALTMPVLIIFGKFGSLPTDVWEAAYMTGWRVIAIAVLFYAATWAGRIALANMNLASVNKHRGMSLQTLQAFHRFADDPAAKDAVVLEAARAVYENVPTGYIARQPAQQGGGARTLELIKSANRGSSESGS
ncbi:MAG: hypothetical protein OXH94_11430 [Rhodospirillales bacterium]|nr:hypothetical protein [Rhodospirillales bacterium]